MQNCIVVSPGCSPGNQHYYIQTRQWFFMANPIMTGDTVLQRYLKAQYWRYRDQGLTRKEAHSAAFQDVREAHDEGYVMEDDLALDSESEEVIENPYSKPIFGDNGPL